MKRKENSHDHEAAATKKMLKEHIDGDGAYKGLPEVQEAAETANLIRNHTDSEDVNREAASTASILRNHSNGAGE